MRSLHHHAYDTAFALFNQPRQLRNSPVNQKYAGHRENYRHFTGKPFFSFPSLRKKDYFAIASIVQAMPALL